MLDASDDHAHHAAMAADAWILTEAYAGLQAQVLGLAEAMGIAPQLIELTPRAPYNMIAASMWPNPLTAVGMKQPPSGLLFTAGGTAAAVGAALRKPGTQVVQVQNPRMNLRKFDLVVANTHDEITGPNVITVRTALHRASPARLAAARKQWSTHFANLPRPLVAVLVGGSNGRFKLEAEQGASLGRSLAALMARDKVGLMLTTSRRTSPAATEALKRALTPFGAYIWSGTGENPYFGMLACADMIIATIDSISMVSEAVATSAPVLLAELPGKSRRNYLFLKELLDAGRVRHFFGKMDWWPVHPMDDTAIAAGEVRRRLAMEGRKEGLLF